MTDDCIFCNIATGDVSADVIYQDDRVTAFHDANPQAPTHVLVIPNEHVRDVARTDDEGLLGHLVQVATEVGADLGIGSPDRGYRMVVNYGSQGGQHVPHLHVHLLGGRRMGWPPG